MKKFSLALFMALTLVATAARAACVRPGQHAEVRERVSYILQNADFVGLGMVTNRGIRDLREDITPILMFKGYSFPSFSIRKIVNADGSVDFEPTSEVGSGAIGDLVVFAVVRDGSNLLRSECATAELRGPSRLEILKHLLKK